MIPEPFEAFDIDRASDKFFLIGTNWLVIFLFLLQDSILRLLEAAEIFFSNESQHQPCLV